MRRGVSGSVLILALWTLFVLGALALAVGEVVSAQIRLARYLKEDAAAMQFARAGMAFALAEVIRTPTNVLADEGRFRDNRSLPGGAFSVYFTYATNLDSRPHIVTNFGIVSHWEENLVNLDSASESNRLGNILGDPELAANILTFNSNSVYESVQQLLDVPGMTFPALAMLEPMVTLSRYRFRTVGGNRYRRESYGGVAVGRVLAPGGGEAATALATRHVVFVYDISQTNYLYWREY